MATGIDYAMEATPTPIGKGTVGEPPPTAAGRTGIRMRVAIFFDGTKNNRANSALRLNDSTGKLLTVKGKDGGSSYGNFYSNPAILELMNQRRDPSQHEVSVYVEGIGTNSFSAEAKAKGLPDEKNGLDDTWGNGFGAGPTGVREKVDKGLNELRAEMTKAYDSDREYIKELIVDVSGFSRGAAAARHFVHRRAVLVSAWPDQPRPELIINFVGIYDTVYSFAPQITSVRSLMGYLVTHGPNMDKSFCNDVRELGLDMGTEPRQVVHLTAGDEHRENFSLTNINSTLAAGKGVEVSLPGAHSDVGGSYAEPGKPELNKEVRSVKNAAEMRQLIADGWYVDEQFEATALGRYASALGQALTGGRRAGDPRQMGPLRAVRSIANEYQFVGLRIMHHFATGQHGGGHEPMTLASFAEQKFATYRVPAILKEMAQHLEAQCQRLGRQPAVPDRKHWPNGTPPAAATCRSEEETKWLRRHYLHRSAQTLVGDHGVGMAAREGNVRLIIPDDDPNFVPPSLASAPATAHAH